MSCGSSCSCSPCRGLSGLGDNLGIVTQSTYPSLSNDEIAAFLAWDVVTGNIVQGYLQYPEQSPQGIVLDWNGRQILVWVDASGNQHYIDMTGTSAAGEINRPQYQPPSFPCEHSVLGVCLDSLMSSFHTGEGILVIGLIGFLAYQYLSGKQAR